MRRSTRFLGLVGLLTAVGFGMHLAPDALSRLEFFAVDRVQLEGLRYLEEPEALAFIPLPDDFSVWDDLEAVGARLSLHPLVAEVRARRRLPSTLVLEVAERRPVALLSGATLTPIDREGHPLPIDPSRHRLDLPLMHLTGDVGSAPESTEAGGSRVERTRRLLAGQVARLEELEPAMSASLSEITLDEWGDVILHLGSPRVRLHYSPPLTPERLREGIVILTDALERDRERAPIAVDLRFADQVVVRYPHPTAR